MKSRLSVSALGDIIGADRGFNVGADILTHTADGVALRDIYNEIVDALAEWNKGRQAVSALFTSTTTDSFVQLAKEPGQGDDFEEASEFGVPKSARRDAEYFRMGFPLKWFDIATRYTQAFLRDASAEQVRLQLSSVLERDNHLVFAKTMKALTDKVTSANRSTNENGVTVYDLWDGSAGEVPPSFAGKTFTDSHSHYLVSGAATLDGGDLKELRDTIQEHGYGLRESGEQVVIMVNPVQADLIWSFRKDPENLAKDPFDFIPAQGAPAYLSAEDIVGDKPPATFNGLAIEGSYGDALITKNYLIPAGYVVAVASGGANRSRNPLLFREHPRPEWRGLNIVTQDNHPLRNAYYQRGFGVGVRHRGAAAVLQIKASGSYVNPAWP
ncbi:hypothetical protein [Microbacterium sp. TNHR37B]|uniref:hypothetical protein n=1 Tax=Microbacterium sp. TNHR37B TaxID=1775956 RepID=UPI0007B20E7E|nr:hypothetical protein [Microbacterium sp. TNHR37B]KZE89090.1 hypothetical protein AVP41_01881 [Microbacterium sp. TNHR37B]